MNHNIRALISIQNSNEMNFELPIIKRENNEVIFRENNCNNQVKENGFIFHLNNFSKKNDVNNLQLENNAINEQPESQRVMFLC